MVELNQAKTCFSCRHFQSGKMECAAYTCFAGTCMLHGLESTCGGTMFCDEDFYDERDLSEIQTITRYCDDWEARDAKTL